MSSPQKKFNSNLAIAIFLGAFLILFIAVFLFVVKTNEGFSASTKSSTASPTSNIVKPAGHFLPENYNKIMKKMKKMKTPEEDEEEQEDEEEEEDEEEQEDEEEEGEEEE
jgi:type IV secretory pathway VirB10-like protein